MCAFCVRKLFNNATANNLISGVTIGLFNAKSERFSSCHQVEVLKTTGSGGIIELRETLVCMTSNSVVNN